MMFPVRYSLLCPIEAIYLHLIEAPPEPPSCGRHFMPEVTVLQLPMGCPELSQKV